MLSSRVHSRPNAANANRSTRLSDDLICLRNAVEAALVVASLPAITATAAAATTGSTPWMGATGFYDADIRKMDILRALSSQPAFQEQRTPGCGKYSPKG